MASHPLWFPVKLTWPDQLGRFRTRRLQRRLNYFFSQYLDGIPPLRVDGNMGPATRKRILLAKYYLGQVDKSRKTTKVNRQFMKRLAHPNDPRLVVGSKLPPSRTIKRGQNRRKTHDRLYRQSQQRYSGKPGVATFDGKQVAEYFVVILHWARYTGYGGVRWHGVVVSGYRTPEYSTHLCIAMCGRPTCPGRCAGASTNHAGLDFRKSPTGAVDVTDYVTFGHLMQHCPFEQLGVPRIFNALPIDPVHFSPHGN